MTPPTTHKTPKFNSKTNIKIKPLDTKFDKYKTDKQKVRHIGNYYYLSWGLVAAMSVIGLSALVANEGGVKKAIQTANFNKLNRQISENEFAGPTDNLPTASIPKATTSNGATKPLDFKPYVNREAKNSSAVIGTTYFSAYLGQSNSKSNLLDLWYSTRGKNPELFNGQDAFYYFDSQNSNYKLVVGKFTDLGQTLKFCAELKFYDISCKYDSKYTNLKTTMID